MITIDGKVYDAKMYRAIDAVESFDILVDSNSGRVQSGDMKIFPIGTYYNHEFVFRRGVACSPAEWDEMYYVLSDPKSVHVISVPHLQGTMTYDAYVSSGKRKLTIEGDKHLWGELSVVFTSMIPQRRA